jgi:polyvinyl alcohol dehydrogenase (cytochrome)
VRTQPSVHDGVAYYCDTAGYLSAVSAHTGALVWEARVAALTGGPAGVDQCRGPPAVDPASGLLVTGSRNTSTVFAVRLSDGKLAWKLVADAHARSVITQPPFVADGVVYAGVSSTEELDAADSAYPCCSFRGSVLAIGAASGELLWKRYTMPQGYVGGAVYGGPVVMDLRRRQIYVATGNLYLSPAGLTDCKQRVAALGTYFDDDPCLPSVVYANSLLALDVDTGAVIWARRFSPATAWNAACGVTTPVWASPARPYNCPSTQALNADFAQGPMLVSVGERDVLVIGQKSGVMWTVNPNTGAVVESAALGPAGDGGGMLWSGANDGTSAYMAVSNSASTAFQLAGAPVPSNNASAPYDTVTTGSALTAVDVATSRIRWQYPVEAWFYSNLPVTSVNDLVLSASVVRPAYATRIGTLPGSLKAHLASTGRVVWRVPAAYTATSGVTAAAGRLLLGVTYQPLASVAGTPRLVAFGVQ